MSSVPPEDAAIVRQVLSNSSNYYVLLGVTNRATEAEIKSAYKKLALRCHPDKNKDPRAAEAFKMVNTANTALGDPEKRRVYDQYGAEGLQRQESTGSPHARQQFRGGGARHMDHDDMFDFIFGGGVPRARQARAQYAGGGGGGHAGPQVHEINLNNLSVLFPFLCFFLLLLLLQSGGSFLGETGGGFGGNGRRAAQAQYYERSLFSLTMSQEEGFVIRRDTAFLADQGIHAQYYVRGNFGESLRRYGIPLRSVETEVLRKQKDSLERRCHSELVKRKKQGSTVGGHPEVCHEFERHRSFLHD